MVFRKLLEQTRIGKGRYETSHRRDLYNSCSSERVWASRGTPYPCSQYDLDECASDYNHPPHSARSSERATIDLERFLNTYVEVTSAVQAAIDRLRAGLQIHDWKPDIVIKAFHDLDIVFFHGKLHGLVTISWHCALWWIDQERSRDGYRHQMAVTDYSGNLKAAIHLNAWGILLDAPDAKVAMWSVVLHEMVVSSYIFFALLMLNCTDFFLPPYSMHMSMSCVVVPLQPRTIDPVAGPTVTD